MYHCLSIIIIVIVKYFIIYYQLCIKLYVSFFETNEMRYCTYLYACDERKNIFCNHQYENTNAMINK